MRLLLLLPALAIPCVAQAQDPEAPVIPADTEVVTTESGLRYSVLEQGEGIERPVLGDRVRVHYTGWLEDGTIFDSSQVRGVPVEFGLGHVIEGWNEALVLMNIGDRYKLTVPPELGYGEEGSPDGSIGAGLTLIFEVELLAITAHSLPHVAWPAEAEDNTTLENGVSYRLLAQGEGGEPAKAQVIVMEFGFWSDEGKILQSDALNGRTLLIDPAKIPFPFMNDLVPHLRTGGHILFRAPTTEMLGMGFDDFEHVVGQLRVVAAMDWAKPEFAVPPDEELTTSESGLRYKIVAPGDQFRAELHFTVVAHYAGWLTDGTQFDASYDSGRPLTMPLSRLIDGWKEGMRLIGRGGKIILVVPSDLGYGDSASGDIPAGSTLVFVVELIEFVSPR